MRTVVLCAFRQIPPVRGRLWKYARARCWDQWPWPVYVGNNRGEFRKGVSLNEAAAKAGAWDVALIVDADVVPDSRSQIEEAAALAHDLGRYVVAYDDYVWLEDDATRRFMDGGVDALHPDELRGIRANIGCVAVSRRLWDDAGGFDPRTLRADWEDLAFIAACTKLAGPVERVPGRVFHLYHGDRQRCASNKRIADEYRNAPDAAAVRAIIAARDSMEPVR